MKPSTLSSYQSLNLWPLQHPSFSWAGNQPKIYMYLLSYLLSYRSGREAWWCEYFVKSVFQPIIDNLYIGFDLSRLLPDWG